jgi:hypothetical protein
LSFDCVTYSLFLEIIQHLVFGRLGHDRGWCVRYGVFSRLGEGMECVDNWCAIDIGWTRLARALGLGPFGSLVSDVLGM